MQKKTYCPQNIIFMQIILFFVICLLISITVFEYGIGFIKLPASNIKLLSDYLPFYVQLFSTKTNDTSYYLSGILIFFAVPVILFIAWKYIKYGLFVVLILISFFFRTEIVRIINFAGANLFPYRKELLFIALISPLIGLSIKYGYTILANRVRPLSQLSSRILFQITFSFIGFLIIFILLFNPKYKSSYQYLSWYGAEMYQQFHHVNFFLAPINEVINGKTLLTTVSTQYGILTTYIPAIIFKIIGISYSNFVLYNMAVVIVYVCIFFLCIKKFTNSYIIGIIGAVSFIILALFRYDPFWDTYTLPSTTPLRYFFDIVAVFLLHDYFNNKFSHEAPRSISCDRLSLQSWREQNPSKVPLKQTRRDKKLFLLSAAVALAFFYNPEFGIPIVVAYIVCIFFDLFYALFIKKNNIRAVILRFLAYVYVLVFVTVFIGGTITIFSYIRSGQFPYWGDYIKSILIFSKGRGDVPMPVIGLYYLPLFIYVISYYYILISIYFKKIINIQLMIFLLTYGLLSFMYYINLSEPNHLLTIIHPSLLLAFIMLSNFKRELPVIKNSLLKLTVISLFFVVIFMPIYYPVADVLSGIKDRIFYHYFVPAEQYYYWSYHGTDFYLKDNNGTDFAKAADKIRQLTKNIRDVLILSRYDSLLYVMSGKTSLLDRPILEYMVPTYTEANTIITLILKKKPKYIFIYADKYNQMQVNIIESFANIVKKYYSFSSHAGAVDVYTVNQ